MFEHFTFGAQPQTRLDDDACPSPTDTTCPITPPPTASSSPTRTGYDELIDALSEQSLQQRTREIFVQQCVASSNNAFNLEIDANDDASFDDTLEPLSEPTTPTESSTAPITCRRLQRQLNVQMQTSATHIRDINTLVEDMIVSNSQCTFRKNAARAYLSSRMLASSSSPGYPAEGEMDLEPLVPDEDTAPTKTVDVDFDIDEGFCDDESLDAEDVEISLRMAGSPSGIRKSYARAGKTADVLPGGKIKAKPRMRKRRVQISRAGD